MGSEEKARKYCNTEILIILIYFDKNVGREVLLLNELYNLVLKRGC
jgi:hypothetical protein